MNRFAEDNQEFKNTVNYYLNQRLVTHSLDEVEELGLTGFGRDKCAYVFATCMGGGDNAEIMSQMVEGDDGMDWSEYALIAEKRASDAIDVEIETQLLILRSDRDDG
jgi:cystathionine beta-lyase family protein involved in aluminum resistance